MNLLPLLTRVALITLCASFVVLPLAAEAKPIQTTVGELPKALPVNDTAAELNARFGCVLEDAKFQGLAPDNPVGIDDESVRIQSSDGAQYVFCHRSAIKSLNITDAPDSAQQFVIWWINWLLTSTATIGIWIINLASVLFTNFLGLNTFIRHPFVTTGWPFLQGIANLGFLLALLFIAAGTTLQIEAFNYKKTLPRLLAAALLINFSLIIGGVVIDFSRLLMAVEVRILNPGGQLNTLADDLLVRSPVLQGLYDSTKNEFVSPGTYSWNIPLQLVQASLVIWAMAVGLLMVAVGLFVRWIALIVLLIFSPLPYLALVFPQTKGLFDDWWKHFMKWVFYGPVLIFFILLISSVGARVPFQANVDNAWISITNTLVLAVLLGMAAKSSVALAGKGGEGIMKATENFARKGVYYGTGAAAAVGLGRFGAKKAAEGGRTAVRAAYTATGVPDFLGERKKILDKQNKKQEEERKKSSSGTATAQRIYDPKTYAKNQTTAAWVNEAKEATDATAPALSASRLRNKAVRESLNSKQVKTIVEAGGITPSAEHDAQLEVLVTFPAVVEKMDEATLDTLLTELKAKAGSATLGTDEKDQAKRVLADLNRSIREIDRRSSEEGKKDDKKEDKK